MTAAALIFALIRVKPSPFYLLDEVDAALDDANVERFSSMVRELSGDAQILLVTHNKKTMELAARMYGVTMREPGVSSIISAVLDELPADGVATPTRRPLPLPAETRAARVALFSVYDRSGVVDLARALVAAGVTIYATGGTRTHLVEQGIDALDVAELTGFPSLFDGRVKTLHPRVFGGILADRGNAAHVAEAESHGVPGISIVVVNLYPFETTVATPGATLEEAVEQIDIGGVSLIRAAAKNFDHVTVAVDPSQYGELIEALPAGAERSVRRRFATRAFERTAEYDAAIARYLEAGLIANELPGSLVLTMPLAQQLRYGENPQSRAAFYLGHDHALPEQLWGKELSYNNLLDLDATLRLLVRAPIGDTRHAANGATTHRAAIVKHTVPCGVAERDRVAAAVKLALDADPISAYGGIIAVDGPIDLEAAKYLGDFFLEIVAAPGFQDDALAHLQAEEEPAHHPLRSGLAGSARPRAARSQRNRRRSRGGRRSGRDAGSAGTSPASARRVRRSGTIWPSPGTSCAT